MEASRLAAISRHVSSILELIEPPSLLPAREGLKETPDRVARAFAHYFSGYGRSAAGVLKVFEDGAAGCDEMVIQRGIPIYSTCEHHLAPFFGSATIGYIPKGKVVGLSKLVRLADVFMRRLQVQERLTTEIAQALVEHLSPDVAVILECRHMCMEARGVEVMGTVTQTSSMLGVFRTVPSARAEFFSLAAR